MKKILSFALIAVLALSAFVGTPALKVEAASNSIGTPVALFETSLASKITSSATSLSLISATTKDGITLASSTYEFIIDEGTASEEFVTADCTGTACTNMQRGLSVLTGTTTVSSLQKEHRRGASVKITDGPLLLKLAHVLRGIMNITAPIRYDASVATTTIAADDRNIVNVELLNDTAFNGAGVISATTLARGVSELSTGAEAAASTADGGSGPLVLPASLATSTYNQATAANRVVVTDLTGKIDPGFVASSTNFTVTATSTFATTTTIGSTYAFDIGKNQQVFTADGTFTVPNGIKKVWVEAIGGGQGGGALNGATRAATTSFSTYILADGGGTVGSSNAAGGGGGGGAFCAGFVDVSATTTVNVRIGAGTAGETTNNGGSSNGAGGLGGDCSGSTTNLHKVEDNDGGAGLSASGQDADAAVSVAGYGGSNVYGRGGYALPTTGSANANGGSGFGYGTGGAGGIGTGDGGAGKNGLLIVRW